MRADAEYVMMVTRENAARPLPVSTWEPSDRAAKRAARREMKRRHDIHAITVTRADINLDRCDYPVIASYTREY